MEFKTSIIDYLGSYEGGVFVKIGIMYMENFYDSLFFYTEDRMILTVDTPLLEKLGCQIEDHPQYMDIINSIITKVDPFKNVYNKLDPI